MEQGRILHIVAGTSRARAEQARLAFGLGRHAEVYQDIDELCERPPSSGVIIAHDGPNHTVERIIESLARLGRWLPVIATAEEPRPGRVVEAIKSGVLDYLSLPLRKERLEQALDNVAVEAELYGAEKRRAVEARSRIATLTQREREVLDWLTEGLSNKLIARELGISPRTVEIHRANMMAKIGATHAAEAVRLRIEADLAASGDTKTPQPATVIPLPVQAHDRVAKIERTREGDAHFLPPLGNAATRAEMPISAIARTA